MRFLGHGLKSVATVVLLLLSSVGTGVFATWASAAEERPNILVLMAEDMGPRVGVFGDTVSRTPNLDAMAEAGVRYDNVFTTAGVCAPSRAAHILGVHQIATGSQHMRTSTSPEGAYFSVPPPHIKAYPELLRAAGYYTFTDSKLDYQFSGPMAGSGPFTIWDADGIRDWDGRETDQPFFGLINYLETHESGIFTPLGNWPHSASHLMMQIARWWTVEDPVEDSISPSSISLPPYFPDTDTVRRDITRHYENIRDMDYQVGRVLEQLEQQGLAENTIVIWTTDHGDGLPRAKRELYDSGIRVPMIIRWPEKYRPDHLESGNLDSRLISFVDLAPAILRMAGVEAPEYLQGKNFLEPEEPSRDYVFASRDRIDEVPDRQRAVRDKRFKYIRSWSPATPGGHPLAFRDNIDMMRELRFLHDTGKLNEVQSLWFQAPGSQRLFDLENDPHEVNDISKNPLYAQDLERLRAALDKWLTVTGDSSSQSEERMVAKFQPGGQRLTTGAPSGQVNAGWLEIRAAATHDSLGYRLDGGGWNLYTEPVYVGEAQRLEIKAVRYGWIESEVIEIDDSAE